MSAYKKLSKAERDLCRILTPEFRLSFPHLFVAKSVEENGKKFFSITMLFDKTKDLTGIIPGPEGGGKPRSLKEVIRNAKIVEFGPKENWPAGLQSPVIDGDDPKFAEKEGYKGHWVIRAKCNEDQRPGVKDLDAKTDITDPAKIYPGCYARAYIYAYVWTFMNKKGVGFILDGVQKLRDGKSFSGKRPLDQVFTPVMAVTEEMESDQTADEEVPF